MPLDNPFWSALTTLHRGIAQVDGSGQLARYPADYAPFLGIASREVRMEEALPSLVAADEAVYLLGIAPDRVPAGWALHAFQPLAQMVCDAPLSVPDGPEIVPLDAAQRDDVLALTALVYPHYFRARTMELGRYFGIYEGERLAAMIGERLGSDDSREMSAICTHPDFNGRGYARQLTTWLTNETLARGVRPFLHVSHENPRAKTLYEQLGYRVRRDIGFWSLKREQP
jgi:GNAT superfamily N-acetyltransferase